jgi:hypothetical protein
LDMETQRDGAHLGLISAREFNHLGLGNKISVVRIHGPSEDGREGPRTVRVFMVRPVDRDDPKFGGERRVEPARVVACLRDG